MNSYEFMLTFRLPKKDADPEAFLDTLYEAGCDDATVGTGRRGMIGLDFTRKAKSAEAALRSAVENVLKAIPGAQLVEVGPDLVNLTDVAELLGCSRQNVRKYATGEIRSITEAFPEPVFTGSPSLWHLAEIVKWLNKHAGLHAKPDVAELSKATARLNLEIQEQRVRRILETA